MRGMVVRVVMATAIAASAGSGATGQEKVTERTIKPSAGSRPPAATIADMARLAGHWTGEGLGGVDDEIWSPPAANPLSPCAPGAAFSSRALVPIAPGALPSAAPPPQSRSPTRT